MYPEYIDIPHLMTADLAIIHGLCKPAIDNALAMDGRIINKYIAQSWRRMQERQFIAEHN